MLCYLYLSVVFHDKYQSYKYEQIQQGNLLICSAPGADVLSGGKIMQVFMRLLIIPCIKLS